MIHSITAERNNTRLDTLISSEIGSISRTAANDLVKKGKILCNGLRCKPSYKVTKGDHITVEIPEPLPVSMAAQNIPLDIVYEDNWITVVNKPRGLVVHPAPGHRDGTLVNALLYHYKEDLSDINGRLRPGIVHRIDKDTSGLLMIVRSNEVHTKIADAILRHEVKRTYLAICCGVIHEDEGTFDLPIGRDQANRMRNAVVSSGKRAVTNFSVIGRMKDHTFLRLQLETGRTHQIRVHMAYIGHPLLGDKLYGGIRKNINADGQMLHAAVLEFKHPVLNSDIIIEAPIPDDFERILFELGYKV